MKQEIRKHEDKYIHVRKDIIEAVLTFLISAWICWTSAYVFITKADGTTPLSMGVPPALVLLILVFIPIIIPIMYYKGDFKE